jgi:hypothetical protein
MSNAAIVTRTLRDGRTLKVAIDPQHNFVAMIDGKIYERSATISNLYDSPADKSARELGFAGRIGNIVFTSAEVATLRAAQSDLSVRTVRIHLSSRGWGDYSSLEWQGDITRADAEILAECRHALTTGHDVDCPDQTDAEILDVIHKARAKWKAAQTSKPQPPRIGHGPGYCYYCETYCYGDCGHYAPTETEETIMRQLTLVAREQNWGIKE